MSDFTLYSLTECQGLGCIIGLLAILFTPNTPFLTLFSWALITGFALFCHHSRYDPLRLLLWLILFPLYGFALLIVLIHLGGFIIPSLSQYLTESAHQTAWLMLSGWGIAIIIYWLFNRIRSMTHR